MELFFVRHGQGEHTLNTPASLELNDPSLTKNGIEQAKKLRQSIPLTDNDMIVCSPVRRTLETASIWSEGILCERIASPLVAPRMFPQKSSWHTLPCDVILDRSVIKGEYPTFRLDDHASEVVWRDGINKTSPETFKELGEAFLDWCKSRKKGRIFVVSHDGTITSYRELITGQRLSRGDFPKDAGWLKEELT